LGKASKRISMKKIWDYIIEMKKEFVSKKRKVYPLSREEKEEVCKFIDKQLGKGYIRLSKSLQMAPVFFDFRYYRKYWYKKVFITPEEFFEPTVMFFRLTNSLIAFQTMINEIL